jgi:TonB family protein
MFESLTIEGQRDAMRSIASLLVSVVAHAAILGGLVVFPLVFFTVVEADELIGILIAPPSTPEPPPAPAAPARVRAVSGTTTVRGNIRSVPDFIPEGIPPADEDGEPLYYAGIAQDIGIVPEGVPTGNALTRLLETAGQPELPPVKPPVRPAPIRVSGPLQEAKLIHKVSPVYPHLAIRAHVSGTVTLEAIIDEEGYVTELKILDGHPLLRNAACEAVRQWRYLPTLIGGEPVPVRAIVSVVFRFR